MMVGTEMMDREGVKANAISAPWIGPGKESATSALSLPIGDGVTATQQYNSGSHVRTPTVRSIYAANVVVDSSKSGGTSVDAIAAYAAMVAFAEMNASDPPPDSILNLFEPQASVGGLTDWDRSYLRALYELDLRLMPRSQPGALAGLITRAHGKRESE